MRTRPHVPLFATACLISALCVSAGAAEPSLPLKAGIIGMDAHALPWTKIVNNPEATGELADMGLHVEHSGSIEVFRGKGCQHCRGTGYRGRTGIHEVLPYSEAVKKITVEHTDPELLRAQAIKEGMVTLRENAIKKFLCGVTTYQEVLRVTWEQI